MTPLRILAADDHALFRAGLKAILKTRSGLEVVGEAGDGAEAVSIAASLAPDIVLMDVSMPVLGGVAATKTIRANYPRVQVIALSAREDPGYVEAMLNAGASDYVFNRSVPKELFDALQAVADGRVYFDSSISRAADDPARGDENEGWAALPLAPRETTVAKLFAFGYRASQIAEELGISARTVESHRKRILGKLGVTCRIGIVEYALKQGWLNRDL